MSNNHRFSFLSQDEFKTQSFLPVDLDSHDSPVYSFLFHKKNGRLGRIVLTLDDYGSAGKDHRGKSYRYEVVDTPLDDPLHIYSSTPEGALKKGLEYYGVKVVPSKTSNKGENR